MQVAHTRDPLDAQAGLGLSTVLEASGTLERLRGHVRETAEILTQRRGEEDLEAWLADGESHGAPALRSLAAGIRRDQGAVRRAPRSGVRPQW